MTTKKHHVLATVEPLSTFEAFIAVARLFLLRWKPVFLAVVTTTMALATVSTFFDGILDQRVSRLAEAQTMTQESYQSHLVAGIKQIGDRDARERWALLSTGISAESPEEHLAAGFIRSVLPIAFTTAILQHIVLSIGVLMILLLILLTQGDPWYCVSLLPCSLFRILIACLLIVFRTWMWVPFIGPLLAVFYVPRMFLVVQHALMTTDSISAILRHSLKNTRGFWLSIVLRFLGAFLVFMMFLSLSASLVGTIALFSEKIAFILWLLCLVVSSAFVVSMLILEGVSMEPQALLSSIEDAQGSH